MQQENGRLRSATRMQRTIRTLRIQRIVLFAAVVILAAIITLRWQVREEPRAEVQRAAQTDTADAIEEKQTVPARTSSLVTEEPVIEEEPTPEPASESRYSQLDISDVDREMLAAIVFLEAGNQSAEGQQAVAEVVLNRMLAVNFPDTVYDVLYQSGQFSPARYIASTEPGKAQYAAVDAAISGDNILPEDVVFFSRGAENDEVWGVIGDHIFCYQYEWAVSE